MWLAIDVGGTFTDAALFDGHALHTAKVPTTPREEANGVMDGVGEVLSAAGADAADVERFVHGTTVGTNALLEKRGARTALVTTRGFEDVLEIARQNRPDLYRLCAPKPAPLVADEDRVGVAARMGPEGIIEELSESEVERVAGAVADLGVESVAIALLFSFADPDHEIRLAEAIRARDSKIHVSHSAGVLPRFREYERTSTTVVDAYLSPLLGSYLGTLAKAAEDAGLPAPEIMRSSGGLAAWEEAARNGGWSVLSGPAGGAVGAGLVARLAEDGSAVGLDMGGTSCDVCVVEDGEVALTESREIGGRPIQLPMVDVHTVGAGGGSIGWVDHGGALRAGPRSAGADPGPACYGRGGDEPTVTDANLVLGRLAPDSRLAGGDGLDLEAARESIRNLGEEAGLDETETAVGIVRVANEEMIGALRVVTVNRGLDPRELALMPFGGAGPMHAVELAEEMGMSRVLCPRAGGVLSALGMLAAPRRRDTARTVLLSGSNFTAKAVSEAVAELRKSIGEGLEDASERITYELRYAGQAFELPVEAGPDPEPGELEEGFAAEHERRYGFRDDDAAVEVVSIALALTLEAPEPALSAADDGDPDRSRREVHLAGEWAEAEIVRGDPPADFELDGPAVFELDECTFVVPPGWSVSVDESGTLIAERAS